MLIFLQLFLFNVTTYSFVQSSLFYDCNIKFVSVSDLPLLFCEVASQPANQKTKGCTVLKVFNSQDWGGVWQGPWDSSINTPRLKHQRETWRAGLVFHILSNSQNQPYSRSFLYTSYLIIMNQLVWLFIPIYPAETNLTNVCVSCVSWYPPNNHNVEHLNGYLVYCAYLLYILYNLRGFFVFRFVK